MRRTIRNVAGWLLALGAAVALARVVIEDATGAPPTPAPPIPIPGTGAPPPLPSRSVPTIAVSRTAAPTTSVPASTSGSGPASTSGSGPAVASGSASLAPSSGRPGAGTVRSYRVTGGQVVLLVRDADARLLSATPAPGYQVRSWQSAGWLRVDFTADTRTSSVFATWNGHSPTVETVEN